MRRHPRVHGRARPRDLALRPGRLVRRAPELEMDEHDHARQLARAEGMPTRAGTEPCAHRTLTPDRHPRVCHDPRGQLDRQGLQARGRQSAHGQERHADTAAAVHHPRSLSGEWAFLTSLAVCPSGVCTTSFASNSSNGLVLLDDETD